MADRFVGTLFGQGVGDALGLGTEFMSKDDVAWYYPDGLTSYEQIIQDAHRKRWKPGSWTDDTDQMTMVLDSFLETGRVDIQDIARRFWNWAFVAGGEGIGNTTYTVFSHPGFIEDPHTAARVVWENSGRHLAPNGGVMRTSVVGLWDLDDSEKVAANAEAVCKITHADPRCIGSCVVVSLVVNWLVKGRTPGDDFFEQLVDIGRRYDERIEPFLRMALDADRVEVLDLASSNATGYTLKTLAAGIWALCHAPSFEKGLTAIIHEGGDADTNGAVAGALLGARFGMESIPAQWIEGLTWYRYMNRVSQELLARARP